MKNSFIILFFVLLWGIQINAQNNYYSTASNEIETVKIDLSTGRNDDGSLMNIEETDTDWYYTRPDGSGQNVIVRERFHDWSFADLGNGQQNSSWVTGEQDPTEGFFEYTSKSFVIPEGAKNAKLTLRTLAFVRQWTYLVKEMEDGSSVEEEITKTQWMDDGAKGWVNSRSPLAEKELVPGKYHIKVKVYTLNSAVRQSLDVNGLAQYDLYSITTTDLSTGRNDDGSLMNIEETDTDWYYTRPDGSGQNVIVREKFHDWSFADLGNGQQNSSWVTGEQDPTEGYFEYTSKSFVIPEGAKNAKLTLRTLAFVRQWTYLVKEMEDGSSVEEEITKTQWMDDGAKGWVNSRSPLAEKELVSGKYHIKVIVYTLNSAVRQSLDVNGLVQYKTEVAKFSADQTSISKNNSIKFTFTPASHDSKQPVSYLWEISLLNDNAKKKSTNSVITSNEQEPVILFDNPGSYTVQLTVTYANGTSSTFKKENYILITDSTMNIEEVSSSKSDILVYPNPTATVFKVKLNPNQTQGKIQILSLNGTILTSTEFANTDNPEVNIQALPSGIYIVKIISNHQVYTKKVTKK